MKKIFYALLLIIFTISFSSCKSSKKIVDINVDNVNEINIKLLKKNNNNEFSWYKKSTTNKREIDKIVNYLQSISFKNIEDKENNGQDIYIDVICKENANFNFAFAGNISTINGDEFRISHDIRKGIVKIYDNIDAEEIKIQGLTE